MLQSLLKFFKLACPKLAYSALPVHSCGNLSGGSHPCFPFISSFPVWPPWCNIAPPPETCEYNKLFFNNDKNKITLVDIGPFTFHIFFLVLLIQLLEKYIHLFQLSSLFSWKSGCYISFFLFISSTVMVPFPHPLILVLCVFLPSFLLSVISLNRHFSNNNNNNNNKNVF